MERNTECIHESSGSPWKRQGVPYTLEAVDVFAEDGPLEGYLKRKPFERFPSFAHGDFHLFEAGANTRYIDDMFTGPALQPAESRDRARMSQIMSILDSHGSVHWYGMSFWRA